MKGILNILQKNPGRRHFYLVFFALAVIMFFLASGAAINIDEVVHNDQAKKVVSWYATLGSDASCLDTGTSNLKYYGQSPDNISAAINRIFSIENEFFTRHFIGLIFSLLLLFGTGMLAIEITGNYAAGIVAAILLFVSPRIMGQAYGNLKDIPFAAGYVWSLLLMIRLLKTIPTPSWKHVLSLGLAIAFTNSVRIGGLVLFGYLALFVVLYFLLKRNQFQKEIIRKDIWKPLTLKLAVVVIIGYFGGLFFWPYGLMNPLKNPIEALSVMEHYKISIKQVFEGAQIWSTNLPWYYLPKWMLISIPEIVLAGFLIFLFLFFKRTNEGKNGILYHGLTGFAFLFPLIYVIALRSNVYSDWRQLYFVYTPMVALASAGLVCLFNSMKKTSYKIVSLTFAAGLALLPLIHTANTYPSDYIYFNSLAGSAKSCWENYEYDYYRHEMKKAAGWLKEELNNTGKEVTVASNFEISAYFPKDNKTKFRYIHFYNKISEQWDYAILGLNFVHPYQLKNNSWQPTGIVKTFYHTGNPTVIVLKGQDKNAYNGYSAFQKRDFETAISLLTQAQEKDPTDLGILVSLGESYLALDLVGQVQKVVSLGKLLNPYYEPFLLMDAKQEMKQGNFPRGLEILKDLVKENPRYFKAVPYLIECYEKTGNEEKASQLRKYSDV
jgi:tetratricopeptide (TPR) repeat protein